MTLKLSKANAVRASAERIVDEFFAEKIRALLGPLAVLHALKRLSAAGDGALADDESDRQAILARAKEQDDALSALDVTRRSLKAEIRSAKTSAEIKTILSRLN